jgi:hypothetical protein
MSNSTNNHLMPDAELIAHLEQGAMQSNPELYAEFLKRMEEQGEHYTNSPEEWERFKSDSHQSVQKAT